MNGPAPGSLHCWIDASAGVAGDMLLGALLDAGAPMARVQSAIDEVIPGTVALRVSSTRRAGLRATRVEIDLLVEDPPARRWSDIRAMLERAELAEPVRSRSIRVFGALADAESRVHGLGVDDVHFHEVGAWDSIADVVGVCAALHELGIEQVSAGPVALGSGQVSTAHGILPVPVPAVLELAAGWEVLSGGSGELASPTGMALVRALAGACEELPALTVAAHGIGAGTRDVLDRANVVRVVIGTRASTTDQGPAEDPAGAVLIEANVDDLDPRIWPSVLADLLAAGASDAWLTPILMKKGRPAHTLGVLTDQDGAADLRARIFALVPTLGLRQHPVAKWSLDRTWRPVDVQGMTVRIKLGLHDATIVSATPEYGDVADVAQRSGLPQRDVLAQAIAAAGAAGLVRGATIPQ